jgi:hypothetical protein
MTQVWSYSGLCEIIVFSFFFNIFFAGHFSSFATASSDADTINCYNDNDEVIKAGWISAATIPEQNQNNSEKEKDPISDKKITLGDHQVNIIYSIFY